MGRIERRLPPAETVSAPSAVEATPKPKGAVEHFKEGMIVWSCPASVDSLSELLDDSESFQTRKAAILERTSAKVVRVYDYEDREIEFWELEEIVSFTSYEDALDHMQQVAEQAVRKDIQKMRDEHAQKIKDEAGT